MAFIKFENVSLEYPVYNADASSLRHKLLNIGTGGLVAKGAMDRTVVKALIDLNFSINDGDRVGIMGHNGAGKTTLLRCASGIYHQTAGNIIREGRVYPLIEIGAGMEPELSGYDNIRRMRVLYGQKDEDVDEGIGEIEKFAELGGFLSLPVRTYSSGMIMRLMFSIATSIDTEILVLDEFFSVGDASFKEKAEERLLGKINSASILLFASHSEATLEKFCNRFFRLVKGRLEETNL